MGCGVIGNTTDSGSVVLGSSPGTPALNCFSRPGSRPGELGPGSCRVSLLVHCETAALDAQLARLCWVLIAPATLVDERPQRHVGRRRFRASRGRRESWTLSTRHRESVTRGDRRMHSDVDPLVRPPAPGAGLDDLNRRINAFGTVLGGRVDLVSYRGLDAAKNRQKQLHHDAVTDRDLTGTTLLFSRVMWSRVPRTLEPCASE